ncbi:MAG: MFS transporter [Bacteroidales bacterium]|nr:MFS transporter [Bacteroidales bacterium]
MPAQKEKLWNSNYWKVMIANFTLFFAFYLLTPLLPIYLSEHFHSSKDMIGLVLSGYSVTAMLFRPFSGFMVDNFQRKTVLLTTFFIFFIFFAGYLLAGTLLLFAVVRTLHGGPFGAITVANSTVAIDVLPSSRRNEGIGYYGLGNNLGMALAPSVGIFLYHLTGSFDAIFILAMAIAGVGLAVDSTLKLKPRTIDPSGRTISLDRFFLLKGLWLASNMLCFGFCFGVLSNYLAIYGKEVMHITAGTGAWFMILAAGLISSRLQGAKALREGRLVHNAAWGMLISLVGYTLFIAVPNSMGYYGSAILIGLGNGHLWPAYQNMTINLGTNAQRGTANSTILISWDIGMGLGCLVGGVVADWMGYAAAFWTTVAVNAIGVAGFFLHAKSHFLRNKLR